MEMVGRFCESACQDPQTGGQLVFSPFGCGFGGFCCALPGVGVSQPENSRPRVKVAMTINAHILSLLSGLGECWQL
jgi:hypothetical protein